MSLFCLCDHLVGNLFFIVTSMGKYDHIPELTGASNFHNWKSHVILALGCEGVYNHVSGGADPLDFAKFASTRPEPADPSTPTAGEHQLVYEWLKNDSVAKDLLCCHLSPVVRILIPQDHSSTAQDAWHLLHSHFDHVDLGLQHLVQEKIFNLQMKDAADAARYLGEHDAFHHDLLQMGVVYSDNEAIFNLLKGLPHTGMWPAFKLVLQSSVSVHGVCSSVSSTSTSTPSTSTSTSSAAALGTASGIVSGSSVCAHLATGTTMFESVLVYSHFTSLLSHNKHG